MHEQSLNHKIPQRKKFGKLDFKIYLLFDN